MASHHGQLGPQQQQHGASWLAEPDSSGLDDQLLQELTADLGGLQPPEAVHQEPSCTTTTATATAFCEQLQRQHSTATTVQQQHQQAHSLAFQQLQHAASMPVLGSQLWGQASLPMLALLQQQNSLPQPMGGVLPAPMGGAPHFGLSPSAATATAAGGLGSSAPEQHQQHQTRGNSFTSTSNTLSFGAGAASGLPLLMFRPAFGGAGAGLVTPAVAAAAAAAAAAAGSSVGVNAHHYHQQLQQPAGSHKSQSPSNSSGIQQQQQQQLCREDSAAAADLYEQHAQRTGSINTSNSKAVVNKGALAQKRFRERQKERMRASEAQVAELSSRLAQLEAEKARLASRARLLEQVVSLSSLHEAQLHTNREIMLREQEMLLEDTAAFTQLVQAAASAPASPTGAANAGSQQQQGSAAAAVDQPQSAQQAASLSQDVRGWTVQTMVDQAFPQYIACLQQLLSRTGSSSNEAAAAAQQQVAQLVLARRQMTDRHALFSHYYWAVWCFNRGSHAAAAQPQQLAPPGAQEWAHVLQQLNLSREQTDAIVAARASLLSDLQRVAADWQRVLPTLAVQLLQVPRAQWHTVGAVQAMVTNLSAEREAVVGFLHTLVDEVLTPVQEGQLEARSYPWCPDLWAIAAAAAAAAPGLSAAADAAAGGSSGGGRDKGCRRPAAAATASTPQPPPNQQQGLDGEEDPMAALAMGPDRAVLQPLMPFMTAFQLLREPVTAKGAGLRLKRALLLDPFRTVVPAAAYPQPSAAEVYGLSLLDAHCGTFQKVMLWDWLNKNLPCYLTMLGVQPGSTAAATAATAAAAATAACSDTPMVT